MSDPWQQAWAEAQATPSGDVVEVWSIELIHPAFVQNGQQVSVRAVNDTQDHALPLEASAPLNPGQTVTFTAIPFEVPWFESQEGKVSELQIRVDNIGREIMPYLDAAVLVDAPILVIFRCHLWSEADGSVTAGMDPVSVNLRQVTVNESYVQGSASPADLVNLQFLRVIYDAENYPALMQ